jgi:pimeloyl-ACP methyl ester carboxylesterase
MTTNSHTDSPIRTVTLTLDQGAVDVTVEIHGHGRPFLVLHGGAGPFSVAPFARLLAEQRQAQVIVPTHPGFGGTPRPDWLTDPAGLAQVYSRLLDELGADGVTVVGSSIGGWIAAELALVGNDRISGIVLVNAVGIAVPEHPVTDVFPLSPAELSRLSFHDPAKFGIDPASMSDAQRAGMAANRATLAVYGGYPAEMVDPGLRERLAKATLPTLVLWGESDQVAVPEYGRAFAAAFPNARFRLLHGAGHLPQIETPDQVLPAVWDFAGSAESIA